MNKRAIIALIALAVLIAMPVYANSQERISVGSRQLHFDDCRDTFWDNYDKRVVIETNSISMNGLRNTFRARYVHNDYGEIIEINHVCKDGKIHIGKYRHEN